MATSLPRWLLTLTLLSSTTVGYGQSHPDPREIAREVHAQGGYDDELRFRDSNGNLGSFPFGNEEGGGSQGRRFDAGGGTDATSDRTSGHRGDASLPSPRLPTFSGSLFTGRIVSHILLVGTVLLLLALVVAVIFAIGRREPTPPARRPGPRPLPTRDDWEPTWEAADPDTLAAEGRYAEAIGALLARALREVGWHPLQERARTAREVLWGLPRSDPRHVPLAQLVSLGERVRFAGDEATAPLYAKAKSYCEALTRGDTRA